MLSDPFLNWFALGVLFFVVAVLFYGIIAIHDIPHLIAKSRNHPHQDAIHAAGWVSLFTLHALWPFLWIWAMAYRPDRGWGVSHKPPADAEPAPQQSELEALRARLAAIEAKLASGAAGAEPAPEIAEPTLVPGRSEPKLVPDATDPELVGPVKTKTASAPVKSKRAMGDR
jgi:hypothetical protein